MPEPSLMPSDAKSYASALALDAWAGSELFRRVIQPIFYNQVVQPTLHKQPGDAAAIDSALNDAAPAAFDYLERALQGDYLVERRASIADVAVVSNLLLFNYLGHRVDGERYPKLARYLRSHLDSPALAAVLRDEEPLAQSMGLDTSILA